MDKLTNLQDTLTTNVNTAVNDQISKLLDQFLIPTAVVTIVIVLFYIGKSIHRYRVDKAIFEIRDTLRLMKNTSAPRENDSSTEQN